MERLVIKFCLNPGVVSGDTRKVPADSKILGKRALVGLGAETRWH